MSFFRSLTAVCLLLVAGASAQTLLEVEQQISQETNLLRSRLNLRPLELDPVLSEIARGHSEEMLRKNFFSHESPNQLCKRVSDRLKHGYRFCLVSAENLHKCQGYKNSQLVKSSMESWIASPPHYHNLTNPQYTRIGVGVAVAGDVALFTQIFSYEPILIRSLDVNEVSGGGYRVKVTAIVTDGSRSGGWFVDGKRQAEWTAGPDDTFSTELLLSQPGELDVGQALERPNWSVETTIPIPPPDKHFKHI